MKPKLSNQQAKMEKARAKANNKCFECGGEAERLIYWERYPLKYACLRCFPHTNEQTRRQNYDNKKRIP